MTQPNKKHPELTRLTDRFTMSTGGRLARALLHALRGRRSDSRASLDVAVGDASRELRASGLSDRAVLAYFSALVEDAGRACGADRPSLMSGELRWMPVRARVLARAASALDIPTLSPVRAMGMHPDVRHPSRDAQGMKDLARSM